MEVNYNLINEIIQANCIVKSLSIYKEKVREADFAFKFKNRLLIKDYKLVILEDSNLKIKFIEVVYYLIISAYPGTNKPKRIVYKRY